MVFKSSATLIALEETYLYINCVLQETKRKNTPASLTKSKPKPDEIKKENKG